MSDYRRYFVPGGTYFFTVVTQRRAPLFGKDAARSILGGVIRRSFVKYPLEVIAIVLLPDHLHTLWSLPTGVAESSPRWSWIKGQFTSYWLAVDGIEQSRPRAYARSFPQR